MFNFLKFTWLYLLISAIVIGAGIFSMLVWGFNYSIEFSGGSNIEYSLNKKTESKKIEALAKKNRIETIGLFQEKNTILIKSKEVDDKKEALFRANLEKELSVKATVLRFETVGPTIGKEAVSKTVIASILGVIGILLYMTYAFKNIKYGFAAVLAMAHDFLVVIGSYSLFCHFFRAEVDTLFVTAVLTTMSFSVHDTIVVFDKIREYIKTEGKSDITYFANKALTETMVRSLNNSMTIVFMLLALVLLGGSTIRFFSATLLIGTLTGTYSSPFIATPILVWFEKRSK